MEYGGLGVNISLVAVRSRAAQGDVGGLDQGTPQWRSAPGRTSLRAWRLVETHHTAVRSPELLDDFTIDL